MIEKKTNVCYNLIGDKMKIQSIKKGKGSTYIIKGDYNITLYDDVILNNNILFKKELSEEEIEKYFEENNKYVVLDKIIKFIKRKTRSCYEIDKEIKKYELNKNEEEFLKNKLHNMNLYNDNLFLDSFIYDKFYLTNDGPNKIKKELLNHKIKEELIDDALSKISVKEINDKLTKLVNKKIRLNHKYSKNEFIKRTINDLVNLGYLKDQIEEIILDNYQEDDSDKLKKEFDKIYNKYQKKYSDNKLILTVKQKLYIKGFNIEDIDKIIAEKKL